ncbi:MAG: LysR family transcriptional regulator [Alphaproteobacteria bacterium]|nr:LysR family transcriptional regulator [Alphaproteobacteria bacterium]MBL6939201.1 LysR family transcriptional regulator [Alphaproteobacteria bacterium]MBL7096717.1 LysR family transcriptional regulator [Alphaproteobacteria bacterium]
MSDIDANNIRRLDGGLLLVFRGLLRRRRTTAVARDLGLSQSAVSHALTRLRDVFDDPLFVRRPHGLDPTRSALELGPRIDALLDQLDATLRRRDAFDPARSTRRFFIAVPEFVAALIGADLVNALRKRAPNVRVGISHLSPAHVLEELRGGRLDLALGRFGPLPPEFVSEPIYRDRYCVAARRRHPQLRGRITAKQYQSIGHVFAYSESEAGPDTAETPEIAYSAAVPGWLAVLMIVAKSDAIATCPRKLAERQARLLGLQVIKPPFEPLSIEVSAVRRAGSQDAGIDWLLGQIREAIG